jgi:hypothetical protein
MTGKRSEAETTTEIFNSVAAIVGVLTDSGVKFDEPKHLENGGVRIDTTIPFIDGYNGYGKKLLYNMSVTIDKEGIFIPLDANRFTSDRSFVAPLGNQRKTNKAARILRRYAARNLTP